MPAKKQASKRKRKHKIQRSIGLSQGKNNRIKRNKSGDMYCILAVYMLFRFYPRKHIKQQF